MKIQIDFTQEEMQVALIEHLERKLGFDAGGMKIVIEVKSKQNYRSEWEQAEFRGSLTK